MIMQPLGIKSGINLRVRPYEPRAKGIRHPVANIIRVDGGSLRGETGTGGENEDEQSDGFHGDPLLSFSLAPEPSSLDRTATIGVENHATQDTSAN
jgi:hypothetical protein